MKVQLARFLASSTFFGFSRVLWLLQSSSASPEYFGFSRVLRLLQMSSSSPKALPAWLPLTKLRTQVENWSASRTERLLPLQVARTYHGDMVMCSHESRITWDINAITHSLMVLFASLTPHPSKFAAVYNECRWPRLLTTGTCY